MPTCPTFAQLVTHWRDNPGTGAHAAIHEHIPGCYTCWKNKKLYAQMSAEWKAAHPVEPSEVQRIWIANDLTAEMPGI